MIFSFEELLKNFSLIFDSQEFLLTTILGSLSLTHFLSLSLTLSHAHLNALAHTLLLATTYSLTRTHTRWLCVCLWLNFEIILSAEVCGKLAEVGMKRA